MKCKQCGSEITDDMMFCGECGFPTTNSTVQCRCPQCGNEVAADDIFCGECGHKLNTPIEKSTDSVISDPVDEASDKEFLENAHTERKRSTGIKSTLPSRTENAVDPAVYSEGKRFLKVAGDFE